MMIPLGHCFVRKLVELLPNKEVLSKSALNFARLGLALLPKICLMTSGDIVTKR